MLEDKDYYMPPEPEECCMCSEYAERILDGEFYCEHHFRELINDDSEE